MILGTGSSFYGAKIRINLVSTKDLGRFLLKVGSLTITSKLYLYKPIAIYKGLLMQIVGMVLVVDHAHPATVSRHEDIHITVQGIAVVPVTYYLS